MAAGKVAGGMVSPARHLRFRPFGSPSNSDFTLTGGYFIAHSGPGSWGIHNGPSFSGYGGLKL